MKKYLLFILITLTSINMLFADKALINAAFNGNLDEVISLLERYEGNEDARKEYVNWQDDNGETALILVAWYGDTGIAKILIAAGADVNIQNNDGYTALMHAARNGRTKSIKLLIEAGADVNIQNNDGYTALIYAAGNDHIAIVEILIAAGASLDIQKNDGATALKYNTVTEFLGESHTLLTATIQSCIEAHLKDLKEGQALSSGNIARAVRQLLFIEKRLLQSDKPQVWSRLESHFGKYQVYNMSECNYIWSEYAQAEIEMAKVIYPSVLNALWQNVKQEKHAKDYAPLFTQEQLLTLANSLPYWVQSPVRED